MDIQKSLVFTILSIVAIAISLLLVQLIIKGKKLIIDKGGNNNLSFSFYFSGMFLSISIVISKCISLLSEAIDNIYKMSNENLFQEIFKTATIYLGLSFIWFLLLFFVSSILSSIIVGNKKDSTEIEKNNVQYVIIKSIILIGTIITCSSILESLLRNFLPSIQIPFYH